MANQAPEAIHIRNQINLARQVDQIGDRAAQILEDAARESARRLINTAGPVTIQNLSTNLAQIQAVLQQAGRDSYQTFVNDLAGSVAEWSDRSVAEVRGFINEAIDDGVQIQAQQLSEGGGVLQLQDLGIPSQSVISEQALRTAARMGPLDLTVAGQKGSQDLARHFANAFLGADGRTLRQGFGQVTAKLQDLYDRSVRQAVVNGVTTDQLTRQLLGDGDQLSGLAANPVREARTLARTGAQRVANAVQVETMDQNPSVERVRYVATLDSLTTPICRGLDQRVYAKGEAPVPPLHFNCRSTLVPHFEGQSGRRPMKMAVQDEDGKTKWVGAFDSRYRDQFSEAQLDLIRRNRAGEPVDYGRWLAAQPGHAQSQVLGSARAATFSKTGSLLRSAPPRAKRVLNTLAPDKGRRVPGAAAGQASADRLRRTQEAAARRAAEARALDDRFEKHVRESSFSTPAARFDGGDIAKMVREGAESADGGNYRKLEAFVEKDGQVVFVSETLESRARQGDFFGVRNPTFQDLPWMQDQKFREAGASTGTVSSSSAARSGAARNC